MDGAREVPFYSALAAGIAYRRGDLDTAVIEAETSEQLALETDSIRALMWARAILTLVAHYRGETKEAERASEAGLAAWATGRSPFCSDLMLASRAMILEEAGESAKALEEMVAAWDLYQAFDTEICLPTLALTMGRLARTCDDAKRLATTTEAMSAIAKRSGLAADRGIARWLEAMGTERAQDYAAAAEIFRGTPRKLDFAECLADVAVAMRKAGQVEASERAAAEANGIFEMTGATMPANRLAQRLGQIGVEVVVPARPTHGWESLTAAESEAARLLGEGLTNAQIAQDRGVSKRTIESHLRRVYMKLDLDSRVKLTLAAAEHFGASG